MNEAENGQLAGRRKGEWHDPATVQSWIANRTGGNAQRNEHLDIVATLLETFQPEGLRVLDLGCGDGMVAELLLQRLPGSSVVGYDSSKPMLEAADARLSRYPGRYQLLSGELEDVAALGSVGPFDAAIGVQSIHHLDGPGKQALFRQVATLLRPGGFLLLSDRVRLASAALFPLHLALWNRLQRNAGGRLATEGYGYATHLKANEARGDRPDTVEEQLDWMREAGFGEADCFFRMAERAIFGGLKLDATPRGVPTPDDSSAELADIDPFGV